MGPFVVIIALTAASVAADANDLCEGTAGDSLIQSQRALRRADSAPAAGPVELLSEAGTDWLEGDRLRAGSCDALGEADCRGRTGCGWSHQGNLCHIRVAWVHVMKTGGSFGTTLAHYANASLPKAAHMPSGRNQSDPEDRTTEGSQGEENFFMYKYPVQKWFQEVFWHGTENPANHVPLDTAPPGSYSQWKGNLFGLFRKPERRTLSAFYHFREGEGDLLEYARGIHGQQASIVSLGLGAFAKIQCEFRNDAAQCAQAKANKPDVSLAIERLKDFAFVGLLEEYDLSVCLFHRMFKSECLPVEFLNMRPHIKTSHENQSKKQHDLALLQRHPDPFDGPFYAAAERIFWANARKYDVRRSTCLETCRGAAHVFQGTTELSEASAKQGSGQESSGVSLLSIGSVVGRGLNPNMEYDWPGRYVIED